METIKIGKIIIETYEDNGVSWVRMKYLDHGTDVIMQENEFEKMYGKFDVWEVIFERINLREKMEELLCIKNFYWSVIYI